MSTRSSVYADAVAVLHTLFEAGSTSWAEPLDDPTVQVMTGLDDQRLDLATAFLTSEDRKFVSVEVEGLAITRAGVKYLERQLRRGENLPLHRGLLERAVAVQERTQRILAEARRLHDEGVPAVLVREQAELNLVLAELRAQLEQLPPPRKPRKRRSAAPNQP